MYVKSVFAQLLALWPPSHHHRRVRTNFTTTVNSTVQLVHRLISGRHTVGFKRVWMLGASEERIRCDT